MTLWAWVLVSFLVGCAAGAGVVWWLARQRPQEVRIRRLHGVLDVRVAGDDDDVDVRILLAHVREQFEAVHPRHLEVRDDEVYLVVTEDVDGLRGAGAARDAHAVPREETLHHPVKQVLVVDDQNVGTAGVGHRGGGMGGSRTGTGSGAPNHAPSWGYPL